GLVTGPLVISHYVRTLFPYERANEEGMGIAQIPSPGRAGVEQGGERVATVSPRELEERLLAEELRELQQRRAEAAPARDRGAEAVAVAQEIQVDLEELSADDLLVDEPDSDSSVSAPHALERLGIDEFDDDSEV